jgi:phage tail P2-like protein
VAIRAVWSPDDCPLDLLPWLAWGLSLDNWSTDWPENIKRERVRKAIAIARRKGTADRCARSSPASAARWRSANGGRASRGLPHTFSLILNLDSAGAPASAAFVDQVIAEVNRAKPARSTFTFTQGLTAQAGIGLVAALRPTIYARLSCTAPAIPEQRNPWALPPSSPMRAAPRWSMPPTPAPAPSPSRKSA